MAEDIAIYERSLLTGAFRQGEILSNVIQATLTPDSIFSGSPVIMDEIHDYAIILTQECDLDLEYKARNGIAVTEGKPPQTTGAQIKNILCCTVATENKIKEQPNINSATLRAIRQNDAERYHYLRALLPEDDLQETGLVELIVDFRRYFTIPVTEFYLRHEKQQFSRHGRLLSPYLEHFSSRFNNYFARVAIPVPHYNKSAE